MFYNKCNDCNECWGIGATSTCKCHEGTIIDWKTAAIPLDKLKTLSLSNIKPNYNMTFHKDGREIGVLDFNGPEMTFKGDINQSAKIFFDLIAQSFRSRLDQERNAEREACAKVCEKEMEVYCGFDKESYAGGRALTSAADAIRARGQA